MLELGMLIMKDGSIWVIGCVDIRCRLPIRQCSEKSALLQIKGRLRILAKIQLVDALQGADAVLRTLRL
jgi:hypothetical protein